MRQAAESLGTQGWCREGQDVGGFRVAGPLCAGRCHQGRRLNNLWGSKQRCGGSPSDGFWDTQEELQGGSTQSVKSRPGNDFRGRYH